MAMYVLFHINNQDQLCGRDPTLTDELLNILTELTQLSKTTNAKVALRARQVRTLVGYHEGGMVFIDWTMSFYSINLQNADVYVCCPQNKCFHVLYVFSREMRLMLSIFKIGALSSYKILLLFPILPATGDGKSGSCGGRQ